MLKLKYIQGYVIKQGHKRRSDEK